MQKNYKNMTIGAIASAIAGAYYLYGSREGVAARKEMAAWAIKMKGDVLEGIEKLKVVSEPTYKEIVQKVSEKYKKVDKGQLEKVVAELHSTWNKMKKEVNMEIAKKDEVIKNESSKMGAVMKKMPLKSKVQTKTSKVVKKVVAKAKKVKKAIVDEVNEADETVN